jgi:PAS domain S-box-containing protein
VDEYPISVLMQTERPFSSRRVGIYDQSGQRRVLDVIGEAIRDDTNGEFLGGVVTGRDVTRMTQMITEMREQDQERFRLICDSMPQLVWTVDSDGNPDFFNNKWYEFTGISEDESLGLGWQQVYHPDDLPEAARRWKQSLASGEPFVFETRCRGRDGTWKWFLVRALPLRDPQTKKIEKWFGTYTDVHEAVETKLEAEKTRQQLLGVLAHARVTIFTVNADCQVTMLEGALIWNATAREDARPDLSLDGYLGANVYDVFGRLISQSNNGERPKFLAPIEDILAGVSRHAVMEHRIGPCKQDSFDLSCH